MMDIQLKRLRMFLLGFKTKSGLLHITRCHLGQETIVDGGEKDIKFVHDTVNVSFKLELVTGRFTGDSTLSEVIGECKDEKKYALIETFSLSQLDI